MAALHRTTLTDYINTVPLPTPALIRTSVTMLKCNILTMVVASNMQPPSKQISKPQNRQHPNEWHPTNTTNYKPPNRQAPKTTRTANSNRSTLHNTKAFRQYQPPEPPTASIMPHFSLVLALLGLLVLQLLGLLLYTKNPGPAGWPP